MNETTTSIDALYNRAAQAELRGEDFAIPAKLAMSLLDHVNALRQNLEAERQRADAVCRDIRIQANDLKSAQVVNKVLQAELAELRGEQEPVAWQYRYNSGGRAGLWKTVDEESQCNMHSEYERRPIFTRQPKPVVVLPAKSSHSLSASSNHRSYGDGFNKALEKVRHILEGAGIVAKDAELDTKPARISVIGSYENSSGGLSSIVTLAEHKGVGMCLVCEGKHPPGLPCPSMKVMSGIETNDGE